MASWRRTGVGMVPAEPGRPGLSHDLRLSIEPANSPVAGILFSTYHPVFHESIDEPGHGGDGHLQLRGAS